MVLAIRAFRRTNFSGQAGWQVLLNCILILLFARATARVRTLSVCGRSGSAGMGHRKWGLVWGRKVAKARQTLGSSPKGSQGTRHHGYLICGIQCKMKMWAPLFKLLRISRPHGSALGLSAPGDCNLSIPTKSALPALGRWDRAQTYNLDQARLKRAEPCWVLGPCCSLHRDRESPRSL